ncbi:ABC-type nitrate/sulfonate/bicarbonate transport system, periplasmic component [Candidatus Moduliflexus flocculans]|uniref:ABC-type nitrate/sulfonate/bicarbonate transport system, periplasmic component n=1 Tax=Candidatus Moduliflexus flocculans TaxID=1499966 RepID=A0A081BPJ6_9BACT|nr:ABC-type nitrate/sulfonate/bicarbonate transport system, periplasmic component [Candidatus Moduliflexus flocculans]
MTLADVEIVRLGNPDMQAAFANGSVDAGLVGAPYADQILADGSATAIAEDLTPGAMTVAFVGSGKFVNERPEVAKRFVLALMEAARLMQGENYYSDENVAAYVTYLNATEETIRKSEPQYNDPNQRISIDGLADIERIHRQNGRVEYTEPVDIAKVVDSTFVEWALSILGTAQ